MADNVRSTPVTIRYYAAENERFARHSFDRAIGKKTDLRVAVGVVRECCTLASARVSRDGSYADLVFNVPHDVAAVAFSGLVT